MVVKWNGVDKLSPLTKTNINCDKQFVHKTALNEFLSDHEDSNIKHVYQSVFLPMVLNGQGICV